MNLTVSRRRFAAFAAALGAVCFGISPVSAQPKTVEVTIEHFAFVPANVTVADGDTIVFVNKDIVPHTATATDNSWTTVLSVSTAPGTN